MIWILLPNVIANLMVALIFDAIALNETIKNTIIK